MLTINDYKKLGFRNCFHKTDDSLTKRYKRYFCKDRVDYRIILFTTKTEPLTTINIKVTFTNKEREKLDYVTIKNVSKDELHNTLLMKFGLDLKSLPLYYPTNVPKQ